MSRAGTPGPMFAGSIPEIYDQYFVPLIFEPYAIDLARRLAGLPLTRVLEIAAGTGALTRQLATTLPRDVSLLATDLSQAMLDHAAAVGASRPVEWQQADALDLPFDDGSFDAVVCQFSAMFYPDRARAYAEARRVLRRGGLFLFNVWDRIEDNEFAWLAEQALATLFPEDPPRFMSRVPHGYHDTAMIRRDLAKGGFSSDPRIETVTARSRAAAARVPAIALCQGSPLRAEIEERDASKLAAATDAAEAAIAARFGRGPVDGKIQAHVIAVNS
ncbi:MAG TPA: class I SAM-dependent methyltransferase [Steroidobacteraceae bacterium]|jgi:SAM-dependent methyltransferase|nr:class I SAM-dependent methyltransferase [Steroidobacteraceae bacterium]